MENIQRIHDNIEGGNGSWAQLYFELGKKTDDLKELSRCNEARSDQNYMKNRYRDVLPYDSTRVKLKATHPGAVDYINASDINVLPAGRRYILSQGPLDTTIEDFWLMVWQQNSPAIIMLNKTFENQMSKCAPYWPTSDNQIFKLNKAKLEIKFISNEEILDKQKQKLYVVSEIEITNLNTTEGSGGSSAEGSTTAEESCKPRRIKHYQYLSWPDFGVPENPDSFLDFLQAVRAEKHLDDQNTPAIVHCSAGIGRSGSFIIVDSLLIMISKGITVSIDDMLIDLRKQRYGLVQTAEQLRFTYKAILAGAKQFNIITESTEAAPPAATVPSTSTKKNK